MKLPAICERELEKEKAHDANDDNDSWKSRLITDMRELEKKVKDNKGSEKIQTVVLGEDRNAKAPLYNNNNHYDVNEKLADLISEMHLVSNESQNQEKNEPLKGENCPSHFEEIDSKKEREPNSKGVKNKHVTFKEVESERLQQEVNEEKLIDISDVTIARGKAATLATRQRQRQRRMTFVAKTEFMANLNSVSHLTDKKILDILSQQNEKEHSQSSENLSARPSPQVPKRASPWKLSTVLGAMRKPSKVDGFERKTSFAQKRQQIIAQQNIKDPLLKQICQTSVCLPPVSDGSVFQPLYRNWTAEDVVFPEHKTEPLTQNEWNQLKYCLYLRDRPIKKTTYQCEK